MRNSLKKLVVTPESIILNLLSLTFIIASLILAIFGNPATFGKKSGLLIFPFMGMAAYAILTYANRHIHAFPYIVPITESNQQIQYDLAYSFIHWLKIETQILNMATEWMSIQLLIHGHHATLLLYPVAGIGILVVTILIYIMKSMQYKDV